mmetsp:Transcript_120957/g.342177  ORF Transcript_120957/g.342177 Transcript_120957/m.342177 type:complete len:636 (-) Transcript_120957:53-1960(-)|eukprot:CAMPEP_0117547166 /NCGR_PEP_ID=MMETSP0784-20121206/46984_1 /TAXON_ID=39447 /ORGANISM="" /LENGTH=635 /DNA_ID=CAMNT_0005344063 /DNA_START=74 /DNA_END=1981 /DNA_ORIENTATION=-
MSPVSPRKQLFCAGGGNNPDSEYAGCCKEAEAESIDASTRSRCTSLQTSKPTSPTCDVSLHRPRHFLREDADLSSTGDSFQISQRANDERLLAMMAVMAQDLEDDEFFSSALSPGADVFEDGADPGEAHLRQDCAELHEEVREQAAASRRLRARLFSELHQLKEQHERICYESTSLSKRLHDVERDVHVRLDVEASACQDVSVRLREQCLGNETLRGNIANRVGLLRSRAAELKAQVSEGFGSYAALTKQLDVASMEQVRLQSELQQECMTTRRWSVDSFLRLARREFLQPEQRADDVSSSSTAPVVSCRVTVEDMDEISNLERQRSGQAQQISELRKQVAIEESARRRLQALYRDVIRPNSFPAAVVATMAMAGAVCPGQRKTAYDKELGSEEDFASPPHNHFQDLTACMVQAESLSRLLEDGLERLACAGEQARKVRCRLGADGAEVASLRVALQSIGTRCDEQGIKLKDAHEYMISFRCQVRAEQAALRQAEENAIDVEREVLRLRRQMALLSDDVHTSAAALAQRRCSCLRRCATKAPRRQTPPTTNGQWESTCGSHLETGVHSAACAGKSAESPACALRATATGIGAAICPSAGVAGLVAPNEGGPNIEERTGKCPVVRGSCPSAFEGSG